MPDSGAVLPLTLEMAPHVTLGDPLPESSDRSHSCDPIKGPSFFKFSFSDLWYNLSAYCLIKCILIPPLIANPTPI